MNLEENCKCKGGGRVGRGPGHRSRSPKARYERGAQLPGIAVQRFVEATWRSRVAIRARLSKRKGKEQFSSAWAVVCRSFWPSFLKSYTDDGQYNAVNLDLWSRMTPWASVKDDVVFAKPGKYSSRSQAGQAKVSEGRED